MRVVKYLGIGPKSVNLDESAHPPWCIARSTPFLKPVDSMWAIVLQVLQPAVRQGHLPSGHPVAAKRGWSHHIARKLFHISATRNIERADGKYMKNCKEKRCMLEPRRIRTIGRRRKKNTDGPDPTICILPWAGRSPIYLNL